MVNQQGIEPGFADQQCVSFFAVTAQKEGAVLVGVEFAQGAFSEGVADEAADVLGAEPDFGFVDQGVEGEVVAGEEGGLLGGLAGACLFVEVRLTSAWLGSCGVLEIARRPRGASRAEPGPTFVSGQLCLGYHLVRFVFSLQICSEPTRRSG